ncbi:MAG: bifunctional precorrin-2 dehydrogenase/sirohydrochlorin ferrochelatase [candidate division FCPU426 bacterium]
MPSRADYTLVLRRRRARVLIAGGGKVAAQKLKGLPLDWDVKVVAPRALASLKKRATWIRRKVRLSDVDAADIIFAATDDAQANQKVAARAVKKGKLVCVADAPELGNFIVPAVLKVGRFRATLSTGGASPALAKALRRWLEQRLSSPRLRALAADLERQRAKMKKDPQLKARLLKGLDDPGFMERILR